MDSRRWIRAALLSAGAATLAPTPLRAQVPPAPPAVAAASDAPADAQAMIARDLSELDAALVRPASPGVRDEVLQQRREEAARRLLSRSSPLAAKYLLDALQSPAVAHDVKTAIARAIADAPAPSAVFVNPLLPLLGADRPLSDAAARALARFGDNAAARDRLIAFAKNSAEPPAPRIGVIRALGGVISRDVGDALVALVSDPRQPPSIQNAAADALLDLTGDATPNHDGQRWKQWQLANANKPEPTWRADVLSARQSRIAREERAQSEFVNEMKQILDEQYQANPAGQSDMLMRLLNSPDPRTRAMGVQRVIDAHDNTKPYSAKAPKRLEELIGDSDTGVRFIAAQAINSINDTDALPAILTQLPQETNPDVKEAQIRALEAMRRIAAVPILRQLLHDPSMKVAIAAAKALGALAPLLSKQNPALSHEVAAELWQTGIQRQADPGGAGFRAATIEAVGALGDRSLARDLLGLLNVDVDDRYRSAALRALGEIGDRDTSFQIVQWLHSEPNPLLRMDAIKALGDTSGFEGAADTLHDFMSTRTEPDENVRKRAWEEFESLLPRATNLQVLNRWQSDFQSDPTHRLPVLLALNEKLQQSANAEDLAASRQNTGETYLVLHDPANAAVQFRQALDYWQKRKVANQVTVQLVKQLLQSLLDARQYTQAVDFAGKQIALDRAMQTLVGPVIRNSAERLYIDAIKNNDSEKMKDALSLIDGALKMQPPLAEQNQTDLRQFQADLQQRTKTPPKP